ncbi:MAG TPA: hypothetical protein VGY54_20070, partial [Polyangiaceae bacterium]|nr:hypothetical protein [Polyangiaceae bacterium]
MMIALAFGAAVFVMPIAALVVAYGSRRRANAVEREMGALRQRLALLESRVEGARPVAWSGPSIDPSPAPPTAAS